MKKLLITAGLLFGLTFAEWYDQGDGWELVGDNVTSYVVANGVYETSMSLTAVAFDTDGNNLAELSSVSGNSYNGDLLGVFDLSGELRGAAGTTSPPFGTHAGQPQFLCYIGGEVGDVGNEFTIKFYDASSDSVIDLNETVTYGINNIDGSAAAPIVLTTNIGSAPTVDGCTDSSACNYNANATSDDGTCTYADQYYDCDDNCLSDADNDGTCDQLEVDGCTDSSACNYNSSATELDDSCTYADQYYDCNDNCLSDTDSDGTCDELDGCPLDSNKVAPGICGCGVSDTDTDSDGTADCNDTCPLDADNDIDNDGVCGNVDACPLDADNDADNDGVCGNVDACPGFDDNLDTDGDGTANGCDSCPNDANNDADNDGVCGDVDACPGFNDTVDTDGDGTADGCDTCPNDADNDVDNDGICGDVDAEPNCGTNDTDDCGVCGGNNACAGCVDPNASNTNLEYVVAGTALDCAADSYTDVDDADTSCCIYTSFSFNQSMNQSAYFFSDIKIDGVSAEVGVDEIYAFNGDVCVGGGTWNGPNFEIMLMGNDCSNIDNNNTCYTDGYLIPGDRPTFKIIDTSTGLQYDAVFNGVSGQFGDCATEGYPGNVVSSLDANGTTMSTDTCVTFPPFYNFTAYWDLGTAEAVKDCNGTLGGNQYIDDCSDCVFAADHNANDADNDTVCDAGATNGEADNCPGADVPNTGQENNDGDANGDACDDDDDNDTVVDTVDNAPFDASSCQDLDGDMCDDCSQTAADNFSADDSNPQVGNDGADNDSDGACDIGDNDDDNDTVLDGDDNAPFDASSCQDLDGDQCDDCSQTAADNFSSDDSNPQVGNDGADNDGDGACDVGDNDDDNDSVSDDDDIADFDPSQCQDLDNDTCDDCSSNSATDFSGVSPNTSNDGDDNDGDGACDLGDLDDDNDTVLDALDTNKNESSACEDSDNDGCDDCSQVMSGADGQGVGPNVDNDGADNDEDGACDVGDTDDDNDTIPDVQDEDDFDPTVCTDSDNDGCDDCSQSSDNFDSTDVNPNTSDDGADNDLDGLCDDGDTDDDNDTVLDDNDEDKDDPSVCQDGDNDTCDDCSANSPTDFSGVSPDTSNDGLDNDSDGACNDGDDDDDNDSVDDDDDSAPFDPSQCEDTDNDSCDDCSANSSTDFSGVSPDTSNDGPDNDLGWATGFGETLCDAGDDDDDNDGASDDQDSHDFDPYQCSDDDSDLCEDCSSGSYDLNDDGVDYDGDSYCDAGDTDDDNDNVLDGDDDCDPDSEGLDDSDFGEDLSSLGWTSSQVSDHDSDGCQDANEDLDDDNDGQSDVTDDCDPDGADGDYSTSADNSFSEKGWDSSDSANDYDDDGCLDTESEDNDDDNDGLADISDDCDPDSGFASDLGWTSTASDAGGLGTDHDVDGCQDSGEDSDDDNDSQNDIDDDCDPDNGLASEADWDSTADGSDYDDDGCQDSVLEDLDDDNDGVLDSQDFCQTGELNWLSNSVTDFDGDGCKDASTEDVDDDNDGACDALINTFEPGYTGPPCVVVGDGDSDSNNPNLCSDTDFDGCEDCLNGSYNTLADGDDADSDGHCNIGDVDILLNQGANSVSFYALPSSGDYGVDNIFGDAGASNDISKVFGEGSIAFNLELGQGLSSWVGSLQDVSDEDGYWVVSDGASALQVQGYPTSFAGGVDYLLHEGNNFISYPYFDGNSLVDALPLSATNNIAYIYGEGTSALFLPNGNIVGSLATTGFAGAEGYWFGASIGFTFEYNEPNTGLGRYVNRELPQVPVELAYKQSTEQYFYFIQEAQVENMDLVHGDWIVAYNNDVVVGARQYDSNAIMVDVPIMGSFTGSDLRSSVLNLTAGYCEPGDIPSIKVHRTNGEIVDMFVTSVEGSLAFSGMGHAIVTLSDVDFPQEVSLHNAYPNPFNPSTMIQYDLPQGSMHVNLSVFDIRGRLVAELVNEIQSGASDSYSVMWNADEHSSGMYFVQLRAGNAVVNQKIMLLK